MDDQKIERSANVVAWALVIGFVVFFGVSTLRNWGYL